ncbi:hypothetical protein DL96DRAFT_1822459 [Flagelloscypha sp. PMI_526]|nr:hypothetical protein DL96DRAFT_1822459 [Flagelloscypha sp. PMI_526]
MPYHQNVSEERIPLRADTDDHDDDANSSSSFEFERSAIDPATYDVESQPLRRIVESQEIQTMRRQLAEDPRFNPTPPSKLKRIGLILVIVGLFWLASKLRMDRPHRGKHGKWH